MAASAGSLLHASAVAVGDRAVLLTGPSGSGKSSLAMDMISRGAVLVADDRTELRRRGDFVEVSAPVEIAGLIEARGVGILRLPSIGPVCLELVVDLGAEETARLPERHSERLLEVEVDALRGGNVPGLAAVLTAILRFGWCEDAALPP
ncbi:MAG: HPr kinase/phosphatase C-terminal domain-containing protein [Rhodobacteraceae bacterium]|nr:HPr kinase/phosphatase C-terminal domain-containing protein [Paracoccaceae bacterium]